MTPTLTQPGPAVTYSSHSSALLIQLTHCASAVLASEIPWISIFEHHHPWVDLNHPTNSYLLCVYYQRLVILSTWFSTMLYRLLLSPSCLRFPSSLSPFPVCLLSVCVIYWLFFSQVSAYKNSPHTSLLMPLCFTANLSLKVYVFL